MAAKKRGLGRGLDALLGGGGTAASADIPAQNAGAPDSLQGQFRELPVEQLQRGRYQPRSVMDEDALDELAASIRVQGIVQPIVVRPLARPNSYEIIAGERRWRAAQLAGLSEVPVVVREVPDEAAIAMSLIENIQREDLNPIEEAVALRRLIDEFEMTHQQASDAVGRSRAGVSNMLRLLELNPDVRALLEKRALEMGHARALLGAGGDVQSRLASVVVAKGLSVRETEQLVRKENQPKPVKPRKAAASVDPDVRRLQDNLTRTLGAVVRIEHTDKGKGKLVIPYNSLDELDGILEHIR